MKKVTCFLLFLSAIFSLAKASAQCQVSITNLSLCDLNTLTTYHDGISPSASIQHSILQGQSISFTLNPCTGVSSQTLTDGSNNVLSVLLAPGITQFHGCNSSYYRHAWTNSPTDDNDPIFTICQ